ncbi:protein croquemort-like [Malaya genurostris]|uniref:protein croquemort-like n=1 Tax=Malaya genurostris TaxID=325434 RepID=UPI0026F39C6A|nr:protein croquemort-like [Malaya genurostris]
MCSSCSNRAKGWWFFGISVLAIGLALIFGFAWPQLVRSEIEKQFVLQPGSQIFDNWMEAPVPMFLEVYLWNWTNTEDYRSDNYKPRLEQLGPYTFREVHERVDLQWNDDYTLTFYQKRIWYYEPELSDGDFENDIVISINPVLLSVGYATMNNPLQSFLDLMISASPHIINSPFYVVPVKKILFEGYDDYFLTSLLEIAKENPGIVDAIELPQFDKFGWFYGRNESETYDGSYTIGTGVDSFDTMGMMHRWNNVKQTQFFRGECGLVHGSTGELWPPFQEVQKSNVSVFSPDICSVMTLEFDGVYSSHGIDGYKWKGNERPFDNGHTYSETECQCTALATECPVFAAGVLDVSRCKSGAPATVSYPHFYLADPIYRQDVDGMEPNKEQHEFLLALEPHTGVPLSVKAQLQVNLVVKKYGITLLDGIPDVMLPILWFRQKADLSEELASDVKLLLILPDIGIYIGIGLAVVGVICVGFTIFFCLRVRWNKN